MKGSVFVLLMNDGMWLFVTLNGQTFFEKNQKTDCWSNQESVGNISAFFFAACRSLYKHNFEFGESPEGTHAEAATAR